MRNEIIIDNEQVEMLYNGHMKRIRAASRWSGGTGGRHLQLDEIQEHLSKAMEMAALLAPDE